MSYYVIITRKPCPYWTTGPEITVAEWHAIALSEPGFRAPTDDERAQVAPYSRPTDIVWTGHSKWPAVWFNWHGGQIDVKNPDEPILAVMARLAPRLDAKIVGEGGERFDAAGKSIGLEEFPEEPGLKKPPWWKRFFTGLMGPRRTKFNRRGAGR